MANNLKLHRLCDLVEGLGDEPFPCIVDGLLPDPTFAMIHAVAKTGKTRFSTQLAMSLSSASRFLGRSIDTKRKICYMDLELGPQSFAYRVRDAKLNLEGAEDNFWLSEGVLQLSSQDSFEELTHFIEEHQIEVLIIDSLSQVHNSNENQSQEMLPIINGLKRIKDNTRCSIILVHHQGKKNENSGYGPQSFRGSSVMLDIVDVSMGLFKHGKSHLRLEVTSRYFSAETLHLLDKDGEFELVEEPSKDSGDSGDMEREIVHFLMGKGEVQRIEVCRDVAKILDVSTKTVERYILKMSQAAKVNLYNVNNKWTVELLSDSHTGP